MKKTLNQQIADSYKSNSQKIRVLTESWVGSEVFCPNCGNGINNFANNKPVADFYCTNCGEEYELKSKRDSFGKKIVDGSYEKMIDRLLVHNNPNFFFLNYDVMNYEIINFLVIPKHFFIPEIIEKRNPLSQNARRSGWIGCNILLDDIPKSGKIFYIKDKQTETKESVLKNWKRTLFLRENEKAELKGWILDVMSCIDKIDQKEFTLQDIYNFEKVLARKHPRNKNVKDKIRQQLQLLRDKGYLQFLGNGKYKMN